MRKIVLLLFLLFNSLSHSQTTSYEGVKSVRLNTTKELTIILPPSYEKEKDRKYPVVYLLDGHYLSSIFAGILDYGYYFDDIPEVIVVGVNQEQTREDETEVDVLGMPYEKGEDFLYFITSELVPHIENKYRVLPFKAIAGHDKTAGFLNFFLYNTPSPFDAYISFCPEFPEDMPQKIASQLSVTKKPIIYFQATSNSDLTSIYKSTKNLDDILKEINNPNLYYKFLDIDGLSHYSLVPAAVPQAIYHVFKGYQPISKEEFSAIAASEKGSYIDFLEDRYKNIKTLYGIDKKYRLMDILAVEKLILDNEEGNKADLKKLASIVEKAYPKTKLSYFIEANYYEVVQDYKSAIKTLEKGYAANDFSYFTRKTLLDKIEDLRRL